MPIVVNAQTGEAESLPEQQAHAALASGTHHVPLYSPEGAAESVPFAKAQELIQQGYTQPTPEENQAMLDTAKYEKPMELAKTFGQGVIQGALPLGAGTALLRGVGAEKEGLQKRAEINPGTHLAGEATGLLGSAALTGGATAEAKLLTSAGMMEAAGNAASKAMGLGAETAMARIGSTATKLAVENMIMSAGSEMDKYFAGNPDSVETAVGHMGLSAIIGGVSGGVGRGGMELWKMGPGKKISALLEGMKKGEAKIDPALREAAGIEIDPLIEAPLSGNKMAQEAMSTLQQSSTMAGEKAQQVTSKFQSDISKASAEAIGRTAGDIESLSSLSKAETGAALAKKISKPMEELVAPLERRYEKIEESLIQHAIPTAARGEVAEQLVSKLGELAKGPNEAAVNLVQKAIDKLPEQVTAQDLRIYTQQLLQANPYGKDTYHIAKEVANILESATDKTVLAGAGAKGPEVLAEFSALQKEYSQFKGVLREMSQNLGLGKKGERGIKGFSTRLAEEARTNPEGLVNKLNLKENSALQQLVQEKFPEVAEALKQHELNKLLEKSLDKSSKGIDVVKLHKQIEAMEPELRNYLLSPQSQQQIKALKELSDKSASFMKPGLSDKVANKLSDKFGGSVVGALAGAFTQSGVIGILAALGKPIMKESSDAVRLGLVKFLGSAERTSAEGFAASVKVAEAAIKGENALNKGVNAVFKQEAGNVIDFPDAKSRELLKKQIDESLKDPSKLLEAGGDTGHYMPEHGAAIGNMAMRNLGYLASLRPNLDPLGPLDKVRVASKAEDAKYNEALNIAQQPLIILDSIKNGTLTLDQVKHVKTMYPELSNRIGEKLMAELINHKNDGKELPYKTKLALSVWAHQPLDSSMSQQGIMSNQMTFMTMPGGGMSAPKGTPAKASSALNKIGSSFMTPQQARTSYKTTGHR